ncbi:MAG: VOC family protein [Fimbriimonadaceae bacterium]
MSARLDMIGLVTCDMARSFRFYRTLGLNIPEEAPTDEPYFEITLESGVRVSWNHIDMVKSIHEWEEPRGQRLSLAFLCDSPGSVDATYAHLADAGFEGVKAPWDAFWGQRYALVRDPDGNVVDLFSPLG